MDAYLDIEDILRVAVEAKADAIHPVWLSFGEPGVRRGLHREGVIFVGPTRRSCGDLATRWRPATSYFREGAVMPAHTAAARRHRSVQAAAAKVATP